MSEDLLPFHAGAATGAVPIRLTSAAAWPDIASSLPAPAAAYAAALGYKGEAGSHAILPGADGTPACIVFGLPEPGAREADPFLLGKLATVLPEGLYAFADPLPDPARDALALCLGAYRFDRYRAKATGKASGPRFVPPKGVDMEETGRIARAVATGRDLINTPANDLGPDVLEAAVRALGHAHGAFVDAITGTALLARGFPMIHAVGRAASRAPRLVDLVWGEPDAPKVTLVGKGVCFDTGGLNLKPDTSMLLMKKDMGGAAAAIACAEMVMQANLPVRLRLLVPAVENSVSGDAFRPGDILPSRKGLSVEIGNTDAEGRLILADALALADEESPDLLIDFATLTGAARVALGPDIAPLYTDDDALAVDAMRLGAALNDPVWRMPFWNAYEDMLKSKVADVNHVSSGPFAGSITAALFLRRFVENAAAYAHLDIFAWNPSGKPGRPEGGEVHGARLVYALLRERYGRGRRL